MNKDNLTISADLQQRINDKIEKIDAVANDIPGVIIIFNIRLQQVEYMSPRGLKELHVTIAELKALGAEYHMRFFNVEDAKDYVPDLLQLVSNNNSQEVISFFQQVRPNENYSFQWYFSAIKLLMHDDDGNPLLTITTAHLVNPQQRFTKKISRLLEEKNFLKNNWVRFNKLSKREKEVLKFTVLGFSASETAEKLHISNNTAETHRRNLKKKLGAESLYDLSLYARAFDLI